MTYSLLRKFLFQLDPERAHDLTLNGLRIASKLGLSSFFPKVPQAPLTVMGLAFPNPVGLAAGLDKNAAYIDALASLGFGFIEVGTVTPRPQVGNPKPRLFRLPMHQALINRMGFNSVGLDVFVNRLKQTAYKGVLGISITANNDTPIPETIADYQQCLQAVYPFASYISLDVSCPNVPNKDSLFMDGLLKDLLKTMKIEQGKLEKQHGKYVPLAVKVSPDMTHSEMEIFVEMLFDTGMDAIIATNTTRQRPHLQHERLAGERGGLSGKPLFELSLPMVKQLHTLVQDKLPIIGVGGIMSANDAIKMQEAGAALIQIYTGLIYEGPKLIREIVDSFTHSSPHAAHAP